MVSNFDFLKNIDNNLYNITSKAEKLYQDGYYTECIIQIRKFGEIVSKTVLGVRRTNEETFDDILTTLKDVLGNNPSDKEFIEDLYFVKKQGNIAAHNSEIENEDIIALECLKRSYEISINYVLKCGRANKKLLNSTYNIEILFNSKTVKKKKEPVKTKKIKEKVSKHPIEKEYIKEEKIEILEIILMGILFIFFISIVILILPF